jgi:hypothetical protein
MMVTWFERKFDYSTTKISAVNHRTIGWYFGTRAAKNGKDRPLNNHFTTECKVVHSRTNRHLGDLEPLWWQT